MQNTIPVRFGPAGSPVNPMVYGQFIEHLLNCIDGGIYDPTASLQMPPASAPTCSKKAEALQPPILPLPRRYRDVPLPLGGRHWPARDAQTPPQYHLGRRNRPRPARPNSSPTAAGSARSR